MPSLIFHYTYDIHNIHLKINYPKIADSNINEQKARLWEAERGEGYRGDCEGKRLSIQLTKHQIKV